MKLSTFLLLDRAPGPRTSDGPLFERSLQLCQRAEDAGVDGIWVAEHHFRDFGGLPDPAVFLAAAARETRRVRLGPAVCVLPFRDPRHVAESYAMVDQLSAGRLEMGVGAGTLPFEFAGFGVDEEHKRARFEEGLALLERLWTEPTVTARGDHYQLDGVSIQVRPVQSPPTLHVATNRVEGAREVGLSGKALLTLVSPGVERWSEVTDRLDAYWKAREEAGHPDGDGEAAVMVFGHVGGSDEEAGREARPAFRRFAEAHSMAEGAAADTMFDLLRDRGTAAFGDRGRLTEIASRIARHRATEVVLWSSFGELELDHTVASLARSVDAVSSTDAPAR